MRFAPGHAGARLGSSAQRHPRAASPRAARDSQRHAWVGCSASSATTPAQHPDHPAEPAGRSAPRRQRRTDSSRRSNTWDWPTSASSTANSTTPAALTSRRRDHGAPTTRHGGCRSAAGRRRSRPGSRRAPTARAASAPGGRGEPGEEPDDRAPLGADAPCPPRDGEQQDDVAGAAAHAQVSEINESLQQQRDDDDEQPGARMPRVIADPLTGPAPTARRSRTQVVEVGSTGRR